MFIQTLSLIYTIPNGEFTDDANLIRGIFSISIIAHNTDVISVTSHDLIKYEYSLSSCTSNHQTSKIEITSIC